MPYIGAYMEASAQICRSEKNIWYLFGSVMRVFIIYMGRLLLHLEFVGVVYNDIFF